MSHSKPLTGKRLLMFVEDIYEDLELWYPKLRLEEEGMETVVAGPERTLYSGKHGYPCRADRTRTRSVPGRGRVRGGAGAGGRGRAACPPDAESNRSRLNPRGVTTLLQVAAPRWPVSRRWCNLGVWTPRRLDHNVHRVQTASRMRTFRPSTNPNARRTVQSCEGRTLWVPHRCAPT